MTLDTTFIERLYEELLARIMDLTLDGINSMAFPKPKDQCTVREIRTRLRGVCRRWNQIVLDNPILWRDVELISPYVATHPYIEEELVRRLYFTLRNGKQVSRRLAVAVGTITSRIVPDSQPPFNPLVLPAFEVIRAEKKLGISFHPRMWVSSAATLHPSVSPIAFRPSMEETSVARYLGFELVGGSMG
ncbi:hypothetical protein FA13DRAFT_163469 [Coprinellus micaceus]|uniref:F-box domain-containing protein n=1 Tax=Coprinellus micaceus TaxID=71717 RepID=A0A4Y7TJG2_COPMI|nr:hypothetical protein FA13DRAFT_163469 [Coprinellus micaceus]